MTRNRHKKSERPRLVMQASSFTQGCTSNTATNSDVGSENSGIGASKVYKTEDELNNQAQLRSFLVELEQAVVQSEIHANRAQKLEDELKKAKVQSESDATMLRLTLEELENNKTRAKALFRELNLAKVQGQTHMIHNLTDSQLSKEVEQLRFNISNITSQYFEADPPAIKTSSWSPLGYLGISRDGFSNLKRWQSQQMSLIGALIWTLFAWIGNRFAIAFMRMGQELREQEGSKSSTHKWLEVCSRVHS
jgi:hypothetical protein